MISERRWRGNQLTEMMRGTMIGAPLFLLASFIPTLFTTFLPLFAAS
jgi:hypothetical protein